MNVILKSDCLSIISRCKESVSLLSDFDLILENLFSLGNCFESLVWLHVKRDGNEVAHHLAKGHRIGKRELCHHWWWNTMYSYVSFGWM